MILFFLHLFGSLLVRLPAPATKALVTISAEAIYLFGRQRRRTLLANLRHAYPDRDDAWVVSTGRESIRQMVEFGLLTVALPCFSEKRLREIFLISEESKKNILEKTASGRPVVALAPHLGPQDALSLFPFLVPDMSPIGAIYRPLKNKAVDQWIRKSRKRFGLKLFSRKRGLQEAIRLLKANEWLGLLFDQNTSGQGALITFFDRVASVTELPGILAARHRADTIFFYAVRRGFWRIELCADPGPASSNRDEITFSSNLWLEDLLRKNEDLLPSWLWAHNRWRHQRVPKLALREKKNLLEEQNAFLDRTDVPRREPYFVRLPETREEIEDLIPLLHRIRRSRPDVAITVIGKSDLLPIAEKAGVCEQALRLPPAGFGSFRFFLRLRRQFPTDCLLFEDSFRSDLEAWLTGAPHRFGIESRRSRRLLTRRWRIPDEMAKSDPSQAEVWKAFLRANGLPE